MNNALSLSAVTLSTMLLASFAHADAPGDQSPRSPTQRKRTNQGPERTQPRDGPQRSSRRRTPTARPQAAVFPLEFRTIDGTGNNRVETHWGAAEIPFLRLLSADYGDGVGTPSGAARPSPRAISNAVCAQTISIPNTLGASDYVWQWGQFVDHDLDETPTADPAESLDIDVPLGDPWFDPTGTGTVTIPLNRSAYELHDGSRQQINLITAWIDGSNVYGSDDLRAQALRTLDGTGRLKTSTGRLLPFNTDGLPNAPSTAPTFFLAGDIRANEQVGLTALHTLFVREHNHWASLIHGAFPGMSGDLVYELGRTLVVAELQAITYREFLPVLLGQGAIESYRGYRDDVDPGISNIFAAAAYRVGHTMLPENLLRLDGAGVSIPEGALPLAQAFFNPDETVQIGIEPILRGLAQQSAQAVDNKIQDGVRNFLFGPPGAGGFDLASLNIQRGRDHGLPSYNAVRVGLGRRAITGFEQIHSDPTVWRNLQSVYATPDDIDAWVGMLAEPPTATHRRGGGMVGRTVTVILADQFERVRDADRFWYESYLPRDLQLFVEQQTLSRIIRRNTTIGSELPANVFKTR